MNLNTLTLQQAKEGLNKKDFSSVDLVKACLNRIRETDSTINAFVNVTEKEALENALKADLSLKNGVKLPLLGIPVSVKDNF